MRHQIDKMAEGRRPEHLLNTPRTVPKLQLRPIVYVELFHKNMQQIALKSYKRLKARDRRAGAPALIRGYPVKQ